MLKRMTKSKQGVKPSKPAPLAPAIPRVHSPRWPRQLPVSSIRSKWRQSRHRDTTIPKTFAQKSVSLDTVFSRGAIKKAKLLPYKTSLISHLSVKSCSASRVLGSRQVSEALLANQVPITSTLTRAAYLVELDKHKLVSSRIKRKLRPSKKALPSMMALPSTNLTGHAWTPSTHKMLNSFGHTMQILGKRASSEDQQPGEPIRTARMRKRTSRSNLTTFTASSLWLSFHYSALPRRLPVTKRAISTLGCQSTSRRSWSRWCSINTIASNNSSISSTSSIWKTSRVSRHTRWWFEAAQYTERGLTTKRPWLWCRSRHTPMPLAASYTFSKCPKLQRAQRRRPTTSSNRPSLAAWFTVHMVSPRQVWFLHLILVSTSGDKRWCQWVISLLDSVHILERCLSHHMTTWPSLRSPAQRRRTDKAIPP